MEGSTFSFCTLPEVVASLTGHGKPPSIALTARLFATINPIGSWININSSNLHHSARLKMFIKQLVVEYNKQ